MSNQGCCAGMKSCISCLVTLAFMGVTAVLLWYFLGQPTADEAKQFIGDLDFGDFTDVLKNISDVNWGNLYKDEDPFVGDNTTNAWATQGTGLSLELQNALDDIWQQEFEEAVSDWEESEVLTLTTTRVAVDHSCGRVDGVMLVCNGNFGETGWVGINEVEIQYQRSGGPGFIISSVAKMNEYYLNNADYNKRLYTMCHEIGHGFGLPHTDENPNNADLGNCLDYTNTPENNLRPGEANFARLRSIYLEGEGDALSDPNGEDISRQEGRGAGLRGLTGLADEGPIMDGDYVSVQKNWDENRNLRRVIITYYLYE